MYDRWLLDAPKLLDASALFGFSNPALARRLLASAVRLEPRYADDLAEAIGAAAEALSQASGADPLASLLRSPSHALRHGARGQALAAPPQWIRRGHAQDPSHGNQPLRRVQRLVPHATAVHRPKRPRSPRGRPSQPH